MMIAVLMTRITRILWWMKSKARVHDDVIKWEHFSRYWPFVRGIRRWPVNSPHKCPWRRALMFSLICAWTNSWASNGDIGDLRRHRAHDVTLMQTGVLSTRFRWTPSVGLYIFNTRFNTNVLTYIPCLFCTRCEPIWLSWRLVTSALTVPTFTALIVAVHMYMSLLRK